MNSKELMNKAADNIRILTAAMVEKAKSGHPGGAMGGADFINVLYSEFLVFDPENPTWEERDRFFLDPGHMSPMLYSVLSLCDKYKALADQETNVIFGGRLGQYRYYDMDAVILCALDAAEKEFV